ncbi:oligopeptide/dipeptide ABC transporter ATP-binding protein [Leisingera daeponensis]|uniref:oligopeptide/dipeptide ABC transporter ATP-binding protein n=1 Tax=Leisingera daeponensis TaxID=405746 RepID=UPI000410E497|nr:oligopeptide/dipeptide ABC transporter ATP-binding protein [Leisingera daeponensis]
MFALPEKQRARLRGASIALIPQSADQALTPTLKIGQQTGEALLQDEPTTGLDVTTQVHILEFLRSLAKELGVAMIYVSYDLGVIARVVGRVAVMYAGMLVEESTTRDVLRTPNHPYTRGLLASIPRLGEPGIPASLHGVAPAAGSVPTACAFEDRCPQVRPFCKDGIPALERRGSR